MKGQYWGEKQDKLVIDWINSTTEDEKTRIYLKLKTYLNYIIVNIMQRYFTVPLHDQDNTITTCMTKVLLNLHRFDQTKVKNKNGIFSFISTVVKFELANHYRHSQNKTDILSEYNNPYRFETNEEENNLQDNNSITASEYDELKNKAIAKLKNDLIELEVKRDERIRNCTISEVSERRYNMKVKFINLVIKFINNHSDYNPVDMAYYIYIEMRKTDRNITEKVICGLFLTFLNLQINTQFFQKRNFNEKYNKVKNDTHDLINDDYVPNLPPHLKTKIKENTKLIKKYIVNT